MSNLIFQCYTCNFCDLKFQNSNDLELHSQLHTCSGEFSCPLCKETFVDLTELQMHDLQHSLEEIRKEKRSPPPINIISIQPASSFTCKICFKVFLSDEELFDHVTHHSDTENIMNQSSCKSSDEYDTEEDSNQSVKHLRSDLDGINECKACKKVFNGPYSLNRHKRRYHLNNRKYTCTACTKTFVSLSLLCDHSLRHYKTARQEFECYICKKHFSSSMLLFEHIFTSHGGKNKHFCQGCFKFFSNKDDLTNHMEDHIAAYNCNKCKKWYKTKSKLNKHRCVFSGPRPYPCKICGKRFSRSYHLQRHCNMHDRVQGCDRVLGVDSELYKKQNLIIKSDDDEEVVIDLKKKYECYVCNTRWYSFKNYEQHFVLDHKELEFNSCPICFKKFSKTCKVKRHLITHSKKKLFKCDKCLKGFSVQSALNRHKKKHNGQEMLLCYHCSKGFVNKLAFQEHILMHEKGRKAAFKCNLCDKKFSKEKLLNEHILEYHDFFKKYQCKLCKKKFSTNSDLSCHVITHKNQKRYKLVRKA